MRSASVQERALESVPNILKVSSDFVQTQASTPTPRKVAFTTREVAFTTREVAFTTREVAVATRAAPVFCVLPVHLVVHML